MQSITFFFFHVYILYIEFQSFFDSMNKLILTEIGKFLFYIWESLKAKIGNCSKEPNNYI